MGKTVKAREHYGAESLDLTIPTKVVREHDLSAGDIFEITTEIQGESLTVEYELVHRTDE